MWFLSQTFLGWNRLIYRAGCSNVNIFMMCSWHFCKHVGFDPRCLSGKWCVLLCFRILPTTLRVRPWKMIDWKMILSFWVPVTFQGRAVKLPRCVCFLCLDFLPSIRWLRTVFTDLLEDPSWVLRFASVFVLDGLHLMAFLKLTASYTALLFFFWWVSLPKHPGNFTFWTSPKTEVDGSHMIFRISIGVIFYLVNQRGSFSVLFSKETLGEEFQTFRDGRNDS